LYQDAEEEIQSDHYQLAIDKLRVIKNKFPYSKYAIDAQLRIADVFFLQESFAEAAASYEAFRELHPKHLKASYAMYRGAKSYMNDMPGTVARDLTSARKALDTYNDFLRRFPTAKEVGDAQKDIVEIRRQLAEKELSIADFYSKRDFYDSAKGRLKKTVELYPETNAAKIAKEKLEQIEKLGKTNPPAQ
jgi:outer membrane protein assembly factor BamD